MIFHLIRYRDGRKLKTHILQENCSMNRPEHEPVRCGISPGLLQAGFIEVDQVDLTGLQANTPAPTNICKRCWKKAMEAYHEST